MAMWFIGIPLQQNNSSTYHATEAHTEYKQHTQKVQESFWKRTTDDPVATFTGMLTIFTGLLAIISSVQFLFVIRSDKTAIIAAKAAKKSADALTTIERAYLYPMITNPGAVDMCLIEALALLPQSGTKEDEICNMTFEVSFKIVNYGKTPAILKQMFVSAGISPSGVFMGRVIEDGILGPGESTRCMTTEFTRGFTKNEADHVFGHMKTVVFGGQFKFMDIWNQDYTTEFEFAWEPTTKRWQLRACWTDQKTN